MVHHAAVGEHLGDVDLGAHLGQFEAGVLEVGHGPIEGLALLHIVEGGLQRRFGTGHRAAGVGQALLGKHVHQVEETALGIAQEVGLGHLDVVEEQLGGVLALHAQLLQVASVLEAFHAPLHQEQAHGVLVRRIGLGGDYHHVGQQAVGDEHLGAVQLVVVALVHGGGAHAGQVGAGGRLGHRHGEDDLAADDARQQPGLLLLVAVLGDVRATQGGVQRDHETGLVDGGQFLTHDLFVAEILEPRPAVYLVRPRQQEPHFPCLLPHAAVHHPGSFPFVLVRHHFLLQEGAEGVAEQVVLGLEVLALHAGSPLLESSRRVGVGRMAPQ